MIIVSGSSRQGDELLPANSARILVVSWIIKPCVYFASLAWTLAQWVCNLSLQSLQGVLIESLFPSDVALRAGPLQLCSDACSGYPTMSVRMSLSLYTLFWVLFVSCGSTRTMPHKPALLIAISLRPVFVRLLYTSDPADDPPPLPHGALYRSHTYTTSQSLH